MALLSGARRLDLSNPPTRTRQPRPPVRVAAQPFACEPILAFGDHLAVTAGTNEAMAAIAASEKRLVPVGRIQHGDHVCAAFGSAPEREELLVEFVRGGLESGDRIWFVTGQHDSTRVLQLLHEALDVDEPLVRGQLVVADAPEALARQSPRDPDRLLEILDAGVASAITAGYSGIRIAGEASWVSARARSSAPLEEWEQRLTDFFAQRPAAGLCQYDRTIFAPQRLERLIELHPHHAQIPTVSEGASLRIAVAGSETAELRLAGQVDVSNHKLLAGALKRAASTGGDIRIDARRLEFIDLSGVGELVRAALELAPDRVLVVHHPPPCLLRVREVLPGYAELIEVAP